MPISAVLRVFLSARAQTSSAVFPFSLLLSFGRVDVVFCGWSRVCTELAIGRVVVRIQPEFVSLLLVFVEIGDFYVYTTSEFAVMFVQLIDLVLSCLGLMVVMMAQLFCRK